MAQTKVPITQINQPSFRHEILTGGSRYGYTGTSWAVLGSGYSYTNSSNTAQKVYLNGSIMLHKTDSSTVCRAALFAGSTKISNDIYHLQGTTWMRWSMDGYYSVAAGATVVFSWGVKCDDADGKFIEVSSASTDTGQFAPTLSGVVVV